MLVFRDIPHSETTSSVLTIGNFDGVHRGHAALLKRLRQCADTLSLPATVLIFEPQPREFFTPASAPGRLSRLSEKLEFLAAHGVDQVLVCRFNAAFAALTPQQFVERILLRGLGTKHLIIGDDFRFGNDRSGNFEFLQKLGRERGFGVEALHTVQIGGLRVSSSAVREALQLGDMDKVELMLGRPYSMGGHVKHGDKIGRTMGFPTANVQTRRKRLPITGVYAVTVDGLAAAPLFGACNIGVRPTLTAGLQPVLEVHILDFKREIYGKRVRVNFLHKLRDEIKFPGLEELKAQIARDVEATRGFFSQK